MLITKFDPYKEFTMLKKAFDDFYPEYNNNTTISAFTPQVNTREGEFAYHVDVDLPGVKKENISIDIDNNKLVISGEREHKEEVKEEDYFKVETSFGKFQRIFTLPENVDTENISATTNDGVLEVVLPKVTQEETKKKIEIK